MSTEAEPKGMASSAGSWEPGAGSQELGPGTWELRAGSWELGAGRCVMPREAPE